jgi:N-acetylglutamate synthase-like GNAT family acetyltransferase
MEVKLRPASRKDIEILMPLFRDLYRGDIGEHFVEILSEYIDSENHVTIVAENACNILGVLVGSYRLDIDYECRAGYVDAIVVDKQFRKRGIGKKLLQYFAQWARNKDCTVLQVLRGKREFFEPRGFREMPRPILRQVSIEEMTT